MTQSSRTETCSYGEMLYKIGNCSHILGQDKRDILSVFIKCMSAQLRDMSIYYSAVEEAVPITC